MKSKHHLTIVIAVFGNSRFLNPCIKSISDTTKGISYNICVMNTKNPRISLAKAWNDGAKISNYDTLCYLNDDTILSEGCLENLMDLLYSNDSYGTVAPTVSACAINIQKKPFEMFKINKNLLDYTQDDVNRVARKIKEKFDGQIHEMDFDISSCCLMMRRSTWLDVGGFFEGFDPAYGEDNDFIDRMILSGLKAIWAKSLFCHHFRAQTAKEVNDLKRNFTDELFWKRFEKRHGISYKEWRKLNPKQ